MRTSHKPHIQHRPISWLLITAILLIALMPAHYHLHHLHNADSLGHQHIIDLHLSTAADDASHSGHGSHHDGSGHDMDTMSFAASPDSILKKNHSPLSPFILLTVVLVLFPVLNQGFSHWLDHRKINLKQPYPHFTPLLRAPPLR